jgi:hypothetical protein
MNKSKTRIDRLYLRIKKNPIVASLIILGTIIIALSTFTNATKDLLGLIITETRPDINGDWKAEVTYDWKNAKYSETFTFSGDGEEVYGATTFLGMKRGILEGKTKNDNLQFITKTQEVLGGNDTKDVVHRYRGKVLRDEIKFVMQTEGGYSEHIPIEFIALRVPKTSLQPKQ